MLSDYNLLDICKIHTIRFWFRRFLPGFHILQYESCIFVIQNKNQNLTNENQKYHGVICLQNSEIKNKIYLRRFHISYETWNVNLLVYIWNNKSILRTKMRKNLNQWIIEIKKWMQRHLFKLQHKRYEYMQWHTAIKMLGQMYYFYFFEFAKVLETFCTHRKMNSEMRIHKKALSSLQYC